MTSGEGNPHLKPAAGGDTMYTLAGPLADVEVDPGSNLLLLGPAMSGKQRLALEILADGASAGEGSIIVSNTDAADRLLQRFEELLGSDPESIPLGIIDCVSKQQGFDDVGDTARIKYAASPAAMTDIGVGLSEFLERFHGDRGLDRSRVMLDSVSTLLMYAEVQSIFRFLHVFTGRVQQVGGLGIYLMDPSAHDERTLNTLKGLFDGVIKRPEADADFELDGAP